MFCIPWVFQSQRDWLNRLRCLFCSFQRRLRGHEPRFQPLLRYTWKGYMSCPQSWVWSRSQWWSLLVGYHVAAFQSLDSAGVPMNCVFAFIPSKHRFMFTVAFVATIILFLHFQFSRMNCSCFLVQKALWSKLFLTWGVQELSVTLSPFLLQDRDSNHQV